MGTLLCSFRAPLINQEEVVTILVSDDKGLVAICYTCSELNINSCIPDLVFKELCDLLIWTNWAHLTHYLRWTHLNELMIIAVTRPEPVNAFAV